MNLSLELSGYNKVLASLNPEKASSALRYSLIDVKNRAPGKISQLITDYYNISRANLLNKSSGNPRIRANAYLNSDNTATITIRSGGISLWYFGPKEFRMSVAQSKATAKRLGESYKKGKKYRMGLRVQIERGGSTLLRGFVAGVTWRSKSGATGEHKGVFRHVRGADGKLLRYASTGNVVIREDAMIGVTTMIKKPYIWQPFQGYVTETFDSRFTYHLKRLGVVE